MSPPKVLGLDHVVLWVTNLDRARDFYCDVLGCRVEVFQKKVGLLQLRAGDSLIDLVPVDGPLGRQGGASPGAEGRNMDHFCLRVKPFDPGAIMAHLRDHGVDPGQVEQRYGAEGMGPSIYLRDPDGNVVELKGPATSKEPPAGT
ncbi:MAG TPA: VOC family protein [Stellaceae bacterium]|nr:VOC family protein [Stellaceae bacterium]